LSETSPVTHSTPQLAVRKPGSIGVPFPDTDIKIVDVETGARELRRARRASCAQRPAGDEGLLEQAGRERPRAPPDGAGRIWFHTGDIATVDEDGYTSIVQRKKDMIIVDGFNVYPSEVEAVLYTHPAVRPPPVIGIPDAYHGETVKACVAFKAGATAGADELIDFCRAS